MPAHKTHFVIAQKLNNIFKLDNDLFTLANVLPDLTIEQSHQKSHFQNGIKWTIDGTANPDFFVEKFKINNVVMLGYLTHLLTDQFFNKFLYKNYYLYDENKKVYGLIIKNKKTILTMDKIKKTKKHDLHVFDKYLLKNKNIIQFSNNNFINKINNFSNISFDKIYLTKYIKTANNEINRAKYSIFNFNQNYILTNQDELEEVLKDCYTYILEYLKKKNIDIKKIKESNL